MTAWPLVSVEGNVSRLSPAAAGVYLELGDPSGVQGARVDAQRTGACATGCVVTDPDDAASRSMEFAGLRQIVQFAVVTVSIFFVVLLVGFAYEWRTGALGLGARGERAGPAARAANDFAQGGRARVGDLQIGSRTRRSGLVDAGRQARAVQAESSCRRV